MHGVVCIEYIDGQCKELVYGNYMKALEEQRKILKSQKSKIKQCKVIAVEEE